MILEKILARKKEEVAEARRRLPLADLCSRCRDLPPPRDFACAIRRGGGRVRLIAELKKASPSRGDLRPDLDLQAVAAGYEAAGAAALSVLTDRDFFKGGPECLGLAREASSLPLLRKDFILDPYQVYEARCLGADALLLIVAALEGSRLVELLGLAGELGLAALVEAHREEEAGAALRAGARVIGINNRDLQTFEVDLGTTERLLRFLPPEVIRVSESGIREPGDVARLAALGADAVLVGEALVTSPDPAAKARELLAY